MLSDWQHLRGAVCGEQRFHGFRLSPSMLMYYVESYTSRPKTLKGPGQWCCLSPCRERQILRVGLINRGFSWGSDVWRRTALGKARDSPRPGPWEFVPEALMSGKVTVFLLLSQECSWTEMVIACGFRSGGPRPYYHLGLWLSVPRLLLCAPSVMFLR